MLSAIYYDPTFNGFFVNTQYGRMFYPLDDIRTIVAIAMIALIAFCLIYSFYYYLVPRTPEKTAQELAEESARFDAMTRHAEKLAEYELAQHALQDQRAFLKKHKIGGR